MTTLNKYFRVSDNAVYELVSDSILRITSGRAEAYNGGRAEAYNGGRAEAYNGGTAVAYNGGIVCKLNKTFDLANDGKYQLFRYKNRFYAGCQHRLTKKAALKHWDREDDRACLFTLAILSLDW